MLNFRAKVNVDSEVKPLTLYFVRHGEATYKSAKTDPKLTKLGRLQAKKMGERLAEEHFDAIYSSDIARAKMTAEEIVKHHQDTTFIISPELREISNAHTLLGPMVLTPEQREYVETERDSMERFGNTLRHTHQPGEKILVVCHGNIIRGLLAVLSGCHPRNTVLIEVNNTSLSILDLWPTGIGIVKLANCVKHLSDKETTV